MILGVRKTRCYIAKVLKIFDKFEYINIIIVQTFINVYIYY